MTETEQNDAAAIQKWQERDLPVAKDPHKYEQMVKVFSSTRTPKELSQISMAFIFDLSYERADICLALHTIELARGWRASKFNEERSATR